MAEIVFAYQGGRDQDLEARILDGLDGARITAAQAGMQGLTEVTLSVPAGRDEEVVHRLRGMPRIVDAARASFGEGA